MKAIKRFVGLMALGLFLVGGVHAADYTFTAPGQGWGDIDPAFSNVPFDTSWEIDLTTTLNMDITFATYLSGGLSDSGVQDTEVWVMQGATQLFNAIISSPTGAVSFVDSLLPGTYTIRMQSDGALPGNGAYGFSATSSAVPLPAALLLFGSALAGFGFFGRRRSEG